MSFSGSTLVFSTSMYEESVLTPWELEGILKGGFASDKAWSAEASGWMGGRGRG